MRRIVVSVLLSFVGPGLGQLYNRDYKKGALLLVLSTALFFLPLLWLTAKLGPMVPDMKQGKVTQEQVQDAALQAINQDRHMLNLISFAFLGLWAYAITQAYFKAKEINEREAPPQSREPHDQDEDSGKPEA